MVAVANIALRKMWLVGCLAAFAATTCGKIAMPRNPAPNQIIFPIVVAAAYNPAAAAGKKCLTSKRSVVISRTGRTEPASARGR
jgi:hypothetical protein